MNSFVHLHVHTQYSLLDGACRIEDLLDKAKELGQKSIAITDHGVMYGVIDFYKEAKKKGIKPIIGCEVYTNLESRFSKSKGQDSLSHLVLLAKNNMGYKNLMKIVSIGYIDGFYYKPRVDFECLEKYSEGIIALSACLAGDIPKALLQEDNSKANGIIDKFINIFGSKNFYLELQDHNIHEQKKVNSKLIEIARKRNIGLVATNDIHYVNKGEAKAQDVLMCIQTGKTVDEEYRMKFETDEFYLKSEEEMKELFKAAPESITNTALIANECDVELDFDTMHLPSYTVPDNNNHFGYLKGLCFNGLERKYKNLDKILEKRLNYELNTIKEMGYVDYFLIVWDFVKYAKDHNIMVGPGRGSAAGSIVAYCLEITNVDPVKYNLLFERFLNPERVSMPDIDIDFCYERRQEVIDYVVRKYGEDKVAQIITFGTMAARAVIRDVGRALNIPYSDVDIVAKQVPFELGMTIARALEVNQELSKMYNSNGTVHELIDTAMSLEGLARHASTHAAGVVISKNPISDYVPLQKNDESIVTQFPMNTLEELGLLKMDFLGLRTLTVIRHAVELILKTHKKTIDINNIDMNCKQVYDLLSSGHTEGVFQLESAGMRQFMKDLNPENLEDIIAGISLYRPGPMDQIPRYIANKNNPVRITYKHPLLKNILEVTYGCIVYQEQVMQIVRELGGYSLGRADLVRRAMSKKKQDVMEQEKINFIYGITDDNGEVVLPGAIRNGVKENIAVEIFDEMMDFAKYAFNKSHAAAYAVIAYQTAWLKTFYRTEYMAALLTSVLDNTTKISQYIEECKRLNIKLLPPDINECFSGFTVSDNSIRFGLVAIKNVGRAFVNDLINERQEKGAFTSFIDFCERMSEKDINKRVIESLIKSGAFDNFNKRSQLMQIYEKVIDSIAQKKKRNLKGQVSLFGSDTQAKEEYNFPDVDEYKDEYLLQMEKEVMGIYVSGHPLDKFEDKISKVCDANILEITSLEESIEFKGRNSKYKDGDIVTLCGIISNINRKSTKNNEMMAFVTIEDKTSPIELIIFPKIYEEFYSDLYIDNVVVIQGKISLREDEEAKILCQNIIPIDKVTSKKSKGNKNNKVKGSKNGKKVYLRFDKEDEKLLRKITPKLKFFSGDTPVYIFYRNNGVIKTAPKDLWIYLNDAIIEELKEVLGVENVKIV